ncbi:MAG: hypothetical protein HN509_03935 [Halobacteriovoraceae bacterium]|jgi:serine protein kinase|nr:hypothetical protein [Halobacteriovoraceae bacterium]
MDWIEELEKETDTTIQVHSFSEYIKIFEEHAPRECRPSYEYLHDMLSHFGKTESGKLKLFETNHTDCPPVFGQDKVQQMLVENLKNFEEEGFNNKFILLVGPNGSSKSSLVSKFMKGAEEYSAQDEGALFSFSWIFPLEHYIKGSVGLSTEKVTREVPSFAHLEDKEVSAIINSELKDHPLLLIPLVPRQKLIEERLQDFPELLDSVRKSYLYRSDLSKRNRMIYDALLKNYKGRHTDVLKHIRVERFKISKRYSTAAVTIEPQIHVDARMQQITMDKRLASLPPSLQSLNLFSLQGEVVMANRGVLEYSDLLKRPLDSYKYLLQTMETGNVNLGGILTALDIFFIGTSNEIHLAAFKQHPDFNSFKGRFNFIRVPYLLDVVEEEKIYNEQILGLKEKSHFEPYALRALCLFSVMSRLRSPQVKNYQDKKLANITTNLNPLEKTLFICDESLPERLNVESKQILTNGKASLLAEFEDENLYEGKFGISPRDVKKIIYSLTNDYKHISFIEVIEHLQSLITRKNEYDFLNMTPQADYHHPARFLALIKEYCLEKFDRELRDSLGLVDGRSYEDYIKRYIENISALIKGEKVKNSITGKYEAVDDFNIKEFESSINLKEDSAKFRSHMISSLGAFSLDHPGKAIKYSEVFPELSDRLQESFRAEQKKIIQIVARNLVFYESEIVQEEKGERSDGSSPLSENNRKQIQTIVDNLMNNIGYSMRGAISNLKYIIKEKY